jgi:probable HAF family extracellular repeat protein
MKKMKKMNCLFPWILSRSPMRFSTRSNARGLWCGVILLAVTGIAHAQFYAVTDLGTLGGTNCLAYGINNSEQIVGSAQTGMGGYHAYMYEGGYMMDLGTLGGTNSWAAGINDDGWMVGAADNSGTNMHAFLCTNAMINPLMMDLGTLGGTNSAAWMVNLHGAMVGWSSMMDGSHHGFLMTNGVPGNMMDLGTAGGTNSEAYGINGNGMVVGYTMMANGHWEPTMSTNGLRGASVMMNMGMGNLGAVGGQSWSVNDTGAAAGQAQMAGGNFHAFVSGNGGMMMGSKDVDLGTLGGSNSFAYCINNAGTVVGSAGLTNGMPHAFMMTNALGGMAQMMDLNDLIPTNSGWVMMEARGINAAGQIVGWGMHGGHTNAFLLTPVSAPVTMMSAPTSQIVGPGTTATWQMQMNASEPLTYQWLHDGVPIPGATNAAFTLSGMAMGNAGQYTVTVRNRVGTVATASAVMSMFSMRFINDTAQLSLAAPSSSHFRVDYSDTLGADANWQTMTNFTAMGALSEISDRPMPGSHARFYRAVMLP